MKCSVVKHKLIPFINDELNSGEKDIINNHFKECQDCQKLYAFTRNSLSKIDDEKRIKSNSFFYQSVVSKMDRIQNNKKVLLSHSLLKYGVAAMLSIMSIVGGTYIGSFGAETISSSTLNEASFEYEIMDVASNDIDLFKDL